MIRLKNKLKLKDRVKGPPASGLAAVGVFMMLCVFPYVMTKGYFNITKTRMYTFDFIAIFFFAACLIAYFAKTKTDILKPFKIRNLSDMYMYLFLLVAVFSCLASYNRLASLSGANARKVGLLMMICFFLAYMFISRFYLFRKREIICFAISFIAMTVFSGIQFSRFNPFGLYNGVKYSDTFRFIGFLGNVNVFSAYVCIGLGLFMALYFFTGHPAWFAVSVFSYLALFFANSDGGYLGLGVCYAVLLIIASRDAQHMARFWMLLVGFFLAGAILKVLGVAFQHDNMIGINTFSRMASKPVVFVPGVMLFSGLYVLFSRVNFPEKFFRIFHRICIIGEIAAVVLVFSAVLYFTKINPDFELGKLKGYLRFNDKWGTSRGYVWKRLWRAYWDLPFVNKLIGTGEETIAHTLESYLGKGVMGRESGYNFDTAHCEPLQYLITNGFWGLFTYLGTFVGCVIKALRSKDLYKKALGISIIVFFSQTLVNITQSITTPFMFVLFGMAQAGLSIDQTGKLTSCTDNKPSFLLEGGQI